MANKTLRYERIPKYIIVKETLRNYTKFRRHATLIEQSHSHYDGTISHSYVVYNKDGTPKEKITIEISFWDLLRGIKKISPRKREALWYSIILDKKQEEVGKIMGCRPVTCGQYANSACQQLADLHLNEIIEKL